jgi:hypothetical protein
VAGPTSTPTPETEINTPQQPGFKLPTVKVKINWDEVDKVNIGIDVGGIVGDALLGVPSPVNAIGYGISEAAEFSGFVKSGIELFQGKPKDMIYWQLSKTAVEGLRLWPGVGTLFDIIDIGMNIIPNISVEITP